jgi:hypothetical protein
MILNVLDGAVVWKTLQKLGDLLLDADHVTFRARVNNRCRNIAPERAECRRAAAMIPQWGVVFAAVAVLVLSIGFALTQPLFAGIVTDLGGHKHMGQAMGLNVFLLFNGFGLGALVFGRMLGEGFNMPLLWFALGELILAAAAVWLFSDEIP